MFHTGGLCNFFHTANLSNFFRDTGGLSNFTLTFRGFISEMNPYL